MAATDFDLLIGSDNVIRLRGLNNGATPPAYYNAADIEATLYDSAGHEVAGQSWPAAFSYIPASDGDYDANLENTLKIGERSGYTLVVVVEAVAGLVRTFRRSGRGLWG